MRPLATVLVLVLVSATAHAALFAGLSRLERPKIAVKRPIELAVLSRQPPPPPPAPKPPPRRTRQVAPAVAPIDVAPPPAVAPAKAPPPTFGLSLSSTSTGGSFAVAVGNTLMKKPEEQPRLEPRPLAPITAVSKLPSKLGECIADYPKSARAEGREGRVVLDVDIEASGEVSAVRVVSGLTADLDDAARAALRACRFTPAEVSGAPVATRIRYTYTFVLDD